MRGLIGEQLEAKASMLTPMASTFVGRLEQEKERLEERLVSINAVLGLRASPGIV